MARLQGGLAEAVAWFDGAWGLNDLVHLCARGPSFRFAKGGIVNGGVTFSVIVPFPGGEEWKSLYVFYAIA